MKIYPSFYPAVHLYISWLLLFFALVIQEQESAKFGILFKLWILILVLLLIKDLYAIFVRKIYLPVVKFSNDHIYVQLREGIDKYTIITAYQIKHISFNESTLVLLIRLRNDNELLIDLRKVNKNDQNMVINCIKDKIAEQACVDINDKCP